ncbi:Acetyltransferase (GNAT) family protein [Oceanicola granulosus HTCC2516]|uniref:Acetyltransferase (GNAT) family protein n=1 Tax=Oceanicola granulosus (strain ATCC BAA-861 / DSM 15982 / KCTC 12143 / HTCC2516) TaxID=314256 RepID=Q2CDP4_OCEGH|nr:GNAT family N-acetyltransferase [Oceanicola granulosus]EAR50806.1 Acetyltransferase (GNAT) family protein [Oceanicola granulosus HTCC2516]
MTRPWLTPPAGEAAGQVARLAAALPEIITERLVLRAPRLADWPLLEPIWTTARGVHIGGPMSPEDAWLDFNQMVASWLLRGHGAFTIIRRADGAVLGVATLDHEWGDPEPEIGWLLTEAAEGHGYAREAGRALRDRAAALLGPDGFVAYVARGHTRSVRVAEALGGTPDAAPHPLDADVLAYRFGPTPSPQTETAR